MEQQYPVLYSFRRCPYAIRARLALAYAGVAFELREVSLKNKPPPMLMLSSKGTVPVLQLRNGVVIDESLDIMRWALQQHDPDQWMVTDDGAFSLIGQNDGNFKFWLDRYKYAERYPEFPVDYYRQQAQLFLVALETCLQRWGNLGGARCCLADAAIFPFIRQFAAVDENWFQTTPYPALRCWLRIWLESEWFEKVMGKFPVWASSSKTVIIG